MQHQEADCCLPWDFQQEPLAVDAVGRDKEQETQAQDAACPICLKAVQAKDTAVIPGCDHSYCVYCIVRWAEEQDHALCPVCKRRFHSVRTFRNLDGTLRDSRAEEGICLLKRTSWYLRRTKRGGSVTARPDDEWEDEGWEDDAFGSNEIDDTEDYYFSNAAGSARIVLANRKFGKNGFIRAGRVYAQSTQPISETKTKEGSGGGAAAKRTEGKKTNTKGKKALRREKKKLQEANRLV